MKLKKHKLLTTLFLLLWPIISLAETIGQAELRETAQQAGFGTETNVYVITARFINGFLSIFMAVFTYFIISAGFMWMTSGGNADKVLSAKTTLKNALFGLILAFLAYAIARYVMLALGSTTGIVQPAGN